MRWSPPFEELLVAQSRVQWLIWGAITCSTLLYIGLAFVLTSVLPVQVQGVPDWIPSVTFLLALGEAAGSMVFRRFRTSRERLLHLPGSLDPEALARSPRTNQVVPEDLERIRQIPESERRWIPVLQDLRMTGIICLALNESAVLMGLVSALVQRSFPAIIPYAILGVCLNLVMRPQFRAVLADLVTGQE